MLTAALPGTILFVPDRSYVERNVYTSGIHVPWELYPTHVAELLTSLQQILRNRENNVRQEVGVPEVGMGWLSEAMLLKMVTEIAAPTSVIPQGRPVWLKPQRFDIWIPELRLAFEYNGKQHYEPVDFFGGREGFELIKTRDERKHKLAVEHDVLYSDFAVL